MVIAGVAAVHTAVAGATGLRRLCARIERPSMPVTKHMLAELCHNV